MTRAKVPMACYEVDRQSHDREPLIVPIPELEEWCAKNGIEAKLYAEDWHIRHEKPSHVFLDISDAQQLISFKLAF